MEKASAFFVKTIWYSLIAFAIFVPWGVVLTEIAVGLAIAASIVKSIIDKKKFFKSTPINLPLFILVLILFTASFTGQDILNSLRECRTFLLMLIIFMVAGKIGDEKKLKQLLIIAIASTTLFALYATIGRTYMMITKSYVAYPLVLKKSAIETLGAQPFWAPHLGIMTEAGQLLIVIALIIPFFYYEKNLRNKIILVIALFIMIVSEVLNFKRGAYATLILIVIFQGIFLSRKIIVVFIIIVAVLLIIAPARERVFDTIEEFSSLPRFKIWQSVPKVVKDYPLGVGFGNSKPFIKKYIPAQIYNSLQAPDHYHNNFLQILVEGSAIALAAFLWLAVAFFITAFRLYKQTPDDEVVRKTIIFGSLSAALAFFINGFVEYNFGDSEVAMLLYLTMGSILFYFQPKTAREKTI